MSGKESYVHGGFKTSPNTRTHSLLDELSKLTGYKHGDQRNGKADEWKAFLQNLGFKSEMVSFLHHRFNILFVLGGATYFHREHLKTFVNQLDSSNFLHQSIKIDIYDTVLLSACRALEHKLVTGSLFRMIEEDGHIFALNSIWENLYNYLIKSGKDASEMLENKTFFEDRFISKDLIFEELFLVSDDPLFETLTQECLEIIYCTCAIMIQSQLKDQLPGGKYYNPDNRVLEETQNCPRTNIVSERDFAQYDRRMHMKPNMTTLAAAGSIMFNNNKTFQWIDEKSNEEIQRYVLLGKYK